VCSSTTFFAYTRSWRDSRLLPAFGELKKLKNMNLWWSADEDTHRINGRPPRWKDVRVAFLVNHYDETVPFYTDLVFRHRRKTIEKFRNGRLVCPSENGVKTKYKITCTDCGLCLHKCNVPKKSKAQQLVQLV
jgi:hypothetical protein